jgi:glycosyltransferase involved in cell wall biosynthesis
MNSPEAQSAAPLPTMVLHVLNSPTGGAALSTLGLIAQFNRRGIRSCAVCDVTGIEADRETIMAAVDGRAVFTRLYWTNRKIRTATWKRPIVEARQLLQTGFQRGSTNQVVKTARRWGADLIHSNTIVTSEGGLAARRLGLPHVWHLRELVGPGKPIRLPFEGPKFGPYVSRHCSKLIANSMATAELVRDLLPGGMLEVVPNGIDLSRFTRPPRYNRAGRVVVAMVANLTSRWKKHALFVEAAARVDRDLPIEWRFYGHDPSHGGTVRGDAYVESIHAQIARAGLSDRFAFPGFVEDPVDIMSEIDIVVHPCDHESFGRIIVEAMAAALPVVGVRGGGVGEIVQHGVTGCLCDNDDPQQLAAGIEQLVRDPARRESMGRAGRQRAESTYSLEACAAGVLRVYEMAMTRPLGAAAASSATRGD